MAGNKKSRSLKLIWKVVKHPLFLAGLISFVIGFTFYFDYRSIVLNPKYAIGLTRQVKKSGNLEYEFVVDGKKYVDYMNEIYFSVDRIIVPDGKYLVIYSVDNPKVALILFNKPILDSDDIDSLINVSVDKNDIKWYML